MCIEVTDFTGRPTRAPRTECSAVTLFFAVKSNSNISSSKEQTAKRPGYITPYHRDKEVLYKALSAVYFTLRHLLSYSPQTDTASANQQSGILEYVTTVGINDSRLRTAHNPSRSNQLNFRNDYYNANAVEIFDDDDDDYNYY